MTLTHLPPLWRFRLLHAIGARGVRENRRLLAAWSRAEGGSARWNPLNTTQSWPGASLYNAAGVKNYPNPASGIAATAATLLNGRYDGLVGDLRNGDLAAPDMVRRNTTEIHTWGTNPLLILQLLG